MGRIISPQKSLWTGAILATLLGLALLAAHPTAANPPERLWGAKPLLEQALSAGGLQALENELGLHAADLQRVQAIASQEAQRLAALEASSEQVLARPDLSLAEKQAWVRRINYNRQVTAILRDGQESLRRLLGPDDYRRLAGWAEARWQQERLEVTRPPAGDGQAAPQPGDLLAPPAPSILLAPPALSILLAPPALSILLAPSLAKAYPRSFDIWATRYDSGDRYVVALPDKCLKFANAGSLLCSDGYQYNQNYSVAISYNGKMVVAPVLESGPWNVDDNYWATTGDPQPRRMFADLPLGVPAAQAAYYNGYNGGLDQFGRVVKSPVAIDISWVVSKDLDLPPGNTKVTVSFLWTEGWDAAQPAPAGPEEQPAAPGLITWATSTPNPDGSLIHEIQSGQTLSGVANVYEVELAALLELNNLTLDAVIQPGDRILVQPALPTSSASPSPSPMASPTPNPSLTPTTAPSVTPEPVVTATPTPGAALQPRPAPNWILIGLAAICFLGGAIFFIAYVKDRRI